VAGTAADLAERVEASGLEGPALLMVGEALRQHNARSADRDVEIRAEAS
jgi:uroporphyrin-III C-methyltransferase/precorrin-2 dehydrogenase/sirohydrochlorin ferrochelatase